MIPVDGSFALILYKPNASISPKLRRVLAYIDQYYAQVLTLRDAAWVLGVHPAHLCRRFKKEIGISFHEYILRIRIQKASLLLIGSEKSIKEISYEVGFSRPEIFSKAFKRLVGCSPMAYRVQNLSTRAGPYVSVVPPSLPHPQVVIVEMDVKK